MATRKKPVIIPQPSPEEVGYTEQLEAKLTYNCRTDTESLTIRTNSESELEELIARWKFRIIPKKEPKPHLKEGEKCHQCEGFLTLQVGNNRKTGKEYQFLGCSNYPACTFSAYLAKEPSPAQVA